MVGCDDDGVIVVPFGRSALGLFAEVVTTAGGGVVCRVLPGHRHSPLAHRNHRRTWMFNHEPAGYQCPFCRVVSGGEDGMTSQHDIVLRTDRVMAMVSSRWWPNNRGHVLVVPTAHHENLYDLPASDGHAVHDIVREIAIAIRHTYGCDGISTRQHNEPAGYQDVWHYHVHVFPRYANDDLYNTRHLPHPALPAERQPYAHRLRTHLAAMTDRPTAMR